MGREIEWEKKEKRGRLKCRVYVFLLMIIIENAHTRFLKFIMCIPHLKHRSHFQISKLLVCPRVAPDFLWGCVGILS